MALCRINFRPVPPRRHWNMCYNQSMRWCAPCSFSWSHPYIPFFFAASLFFAFTRHSSARRWPLAAIKRLLSLLLHYTTRGLYFIDQLFTTRFSSATSSLHHSTAVYTYTLFGLACASPQTRIHSTPNHTLSKYSFIFISWFNIKKLILPAWFLLLIVCSIFEFQSIIYSFVAFKENNLFRHV